MSLSQIPLSRIRGDFSARAKGIDSTHLAALMEFDGVLPPIVVHKRSYRIIDGIHRLHVARAQGRDEIGAALFDGSDAEAFALSVLLNVRHGLPLSLGDRKRAALRMLVSNPYWSDRLVAAVAGLSPATIGKLRRSSTVHSNQSNGRTGRDGRARPIDPVQGRLHAANLLTENPQLSLRELARAAEISISTARDVRLRFRAGASPIPTRLQEKTSETSAQGGGKPGTSASRGEHMHAPSGTAVSPLDEQNSGEATSRETGEDVPVHLVLERLKRDPAVRFNENGRSLIRQLVAAGQMVTSCQQMLPFAPEHCLPTLAQIAKTHAAAWQQLADVAEAAADMREAL